jgi:hypothetical protein
VWSRRWWTGAAAGECTGQLTVTEGRQFAAVQAWFGLQQRQGFGRGGKRFILLTVDGPKNDEAQ